MRKDKVGTITNFGYDELFIIPRKNLKIEESQMLKNIKNIELKNTLLSEKFDYDYIDILIRDKLMLGKKGETTYIVIDNEG